MASYTPNFNLKKPADSDSYDIADHNGNMDKIDTALNTLNSKIANLFQIYTYNFNPVTITGNGNANVSATNKSSKPAGYSSLAPYEMATGNVDVLIRGFSTAEGELYLVNRSSSSVTITPTFKIMIYKE